MSVTFAKYSLAGWCAEAAGHVFDASDYAWPVKLEEGSARPLIKMFDVKKRQYFGNTSMEAEISLLMANQTLVITVTIPSVNLVASSLMRHMTGITRKVNL